MVYALEYRAFDSLLHAVVKCVQDDSPLGEVDSRVFEEIVEEDLKYFECRLSPWMERNVRR